MIFFILVLLSLNLLHTILNLSLYNSIRSILIFSFFLAIFSFSIYPYSIRVNINMIYFLLNDYNTLSFLCVIQIIESMIFMIFCVLLIKEHYHEKIISVAKIIPLFPSLIFLTGVFLLKTYLFNTITDIDFFYIAIIFSILFPLFIFLISILIKKIISNWELRMELKIILSFFQIVLAMFLPLLLMGMQVQGTQLSINIKTSIMSYIFFAGLIIVGIYKNKFKIFTQKYVTQFLTKRLSSQSK